MWDWLAFIWMVKQFLLYFSNPVIKIQTGSKGLISDSLSK